MHKQRRAIMMDTEQKLNAVLTPAQQQQYATMKEQRRHGQAQPATVPRPRTFAVRITGHPAASRLGGFASGFGIYLAIIHTAFLRKIDGWISL